MRVIRFLFRHWATILSMPLALGVAAWVVGRLASDRWLWSQWLLFVPTPAPIAAALIGLVLAARPSPSPLQRRRRLTVWSMTLAFITGYFTMVEHRLLSRPADAAGGLHVVHWNMSDFKPPPVVDRYVDAVQRLGGDIVVLTGAGTVPSDARLQAWLGPDIQTAWSYPFTVFSQLPIRQLTPLVRSQEFAVDMVVIDASGMLGRDLIMYLVDLPSSPKIPRAPTAQMLRRLMDQTDAPAPDLVVGDFNMTRGSAATRLIFPGLRDAYDEAGTGYAASFPRDWPLIQIDHMLLGTHLRALRYELIDPGVSRHRAQAAWITNR